jgi:hypothetical protein
MPQSGLTRKFDLDRYAEAVEQLVDEERKAIRGQ